MGGVGGRELMWEVIQKFSSTQTEAPIDANKPIHISKFLCPFNSASVSSIYFMMLSVVNDCLPIGKAF